jgi:hypothetical protein
MSEDLELRVDQSQGELDKLDEGNLAVQVRFVQVHILRDLTHAETVICNIILNVEVEQLAELFGFFSAKCSFLVANCQFDEELLKRFFVAVHQVIYLIFVKISFSKDMIISRMDPMVGQYVHFNKLLKGISNCLAIASLLILYFGDTN